MDKEKIKYIIKKDVLGWGIFTAIFWSLLMACSKPESFFDFQLPNWKKFFQFLIVAIPVFSIGGFFQGMFMYKRHQKAAMLPKPKNELVIIIWIFIIAVAVAALLSLYFTHLFTLAKFFQFFIIAFTILVLLGFLVAASIYSSKNKKN